MAVQIATDADFAQIVKDNNRVVVKYLQIGVAHVKCLPQNIKE